MQAARQVVREFCQLSAQISEAECKRFLTQLAELSPEKMQNWLDRFQTRRELVSHRGYVEKFVRTLSVERSIRRQRAQRQIAANSAEQRRQYQMVDKLLGQTLVRVPDTTRYRVSAKPFSNFPVEVARFNPFEAVIDPSSPRGFRRQLAASISLPGDLPAGDPANFEEVPEPE